jgi:hypothetical protein
VRATLRIRPLFSVVKDVPSQPLCLRLCVRMCGRGRGSPEYLLDRSFHHFQANASVPALEGRTLRRGRAAQEEGVASTHDRQGWGPQSWPRWRRRAPTWTLPMRRRWPIFMRRVHSACGTKATCAR